MRGEDLPKWLHSRIVLDDGMMGAISRTNEEHPRRNLGDQADEVVPDHVYEVLRELFGACATKLSDGNTEVFAEIAPAASVFVEGFGRGRGDDPTARDDVLRMCEGAAEFEGVNRLRAGFSFWCDAVEETDPDRRSQLILAGSLQLGAHEQNHLQGAIAGSMDMGVDEAIDRLKLRVARKKGPLAELDELLSPVLEPLRRSLRDLWGELMTELLGTIVTPDGTLRLDRDVPPLAGQPFRPPDLVTVLVADLASLLSRFDRSAGNGAESRARNWANLDDRMDFITNLFVSRHHRASFFERPFTPEVLAAIEAGRLPDQVFRAPAPAAPTTVQKRRGPADRAPRGKAPSVGTDRFTGAFLDELREEGDPPADEAVATFFEATGEGHAELFRRLALHSPGVVDDEALPGVGSFVEAVEPWPKWADPELVERGQRVFGDWGPQLGMGLWMASLPADYACAKGAVPLVRTARLTGKPKRRYVETGQMIIDAMTPKALEPGARGYRTVRHVRLMHAAVRHVLLHAKELEAEAARRIEGWEESLGAPLNQEDLLGCLFSFNVVGIDALRRSGVRLKEEDVEAYIHVWNLVGHQIGILHEVLPLNWQDGREVWDRLKRRNYASSEAGRELTGAAISCMQDLIRVPLLRGLPATGIRHYLGNETADLLGVPSADWTRLFFLFVQSTDLVFNVIFSRTSGMRLLTALVGRRMLEGFELCERDGERPNFQITEELKQAWGMSTP